MNTDHFMTDRRHLSDEGTALYVDAILLNKTDRLPEEMRRHTESCEPCQRKVIELHDLMKETAYIPSLPHPYFDSAVKEPAVSYTAYRIAAVAAGIGLLAAGYYMIVNNSSAPPEHSVRTGTEQLPDSSVTKTPVEQPAPEKKELLLADNFSESAHLEDLVHGGFRATAVEVISPKNGDIVTIPVTFRWKHIDRPVTVIILSNKERTLVSAKVSGDSYVSKKNFAPGLYYWKLETEKELLYAGKFLVR